MNHLLSIIYLAVYTRSSCPVQCASVCTVNVLDMPACLHSLLYMKPCALERIAADAAACAHNPKKKHNASLQTGLKPSFPGNI